MLTYDSFMATCQKCIIIAKAGALILFALLIIILAVDIYRAEKKR